MSAISVSDLLQQIKNTYKDKGQLESANKVVAIVQRLKLGTLVFDRKEKEFLLINGHHSIVDLQTFLCRTPEFMRQPTPDWQPQVLDDGQGHIKIIMICDFDPVGLLKIVNR